MNKDKYEKIFNSKVNLPSKSSSSKSTRSLKLYKPDEVIKKFNTKKENQVLPTTETETLTSNPDSNIITNRLNNNRFKTNYNKKIVYNRNKDKWNKNNFRTSYDLSTIYINDEVVKECKINNLSVKLIQNVIINLNKSNEKVKLKNFLKLSNSLFMHFLKFCHDFYGNIFESHKLLKCKTLLVFNNYISHLVNDFNILYKDYFILTATRQIHHDNCFYYELNSKVITKSLYTLSFSIRLRYLGKNYYLSLIWKIDIREKRNIHLWIASEKEGDNCFSYIQPVAHLSEGDYFSIKIPILNRYGIVDHSATIWEKIIIEKTPKVIYEDTHEKVQINKLRTCEFEILSYRWKDIKYNPNPIYIIEKLDNIISQSFKIISINYDFSNLFIIKVKTQAIKKGMIKKNDIFNFSILIKDVDESINKEINSLHILNIVNNKYEMRVNDIVYFYLKDSF